MAEGIRAVLSYLFVISYVCGIRIIEYPVGRRRLWFSLFYCSLLWFSYLFFLGYTVIPYIPSYSKRYEFCMLLNLFSVVLSVALQIIYDKKFRNCLERLNIVDETLRELGITKDCKKYKIRMILVILGWVIMCIFVNYIESIWWGQLYNSIKGHYIPFMMNYACNINTIGDMIFLNTLQYIMMKYDQINELICKLTDNEAADEKLKLRPAWESSVLYSQQRSSSNVLGSKCLLWIVMHLHLELRKISHEINSIFAMQMTIKMACYFGFIAYLICEIFDTLFRSDSHSKTIFFVMDMSKLIIYITRLFLINWTCERVGDKANALGDAICKISYSTSDTEIRENIAQILLQITRTPIRFCGLGLFQFGFKYFHRYLESILIVIVILLQVNEKDYTYLRWVK